MQWEKLTSDEFAEAVRETGVCILPMGVLERHSAHLPLGTDMFLSHHIASKAAEMEPAVVFPQFYFGQIWEARCFPGTVAVPPKVLLDVIWATLDEIARNGFRKIIVHNGHGGNWAMLRFLAQATLAEQKPYSLYVQTELISPDRKEQYNKIFETTYHGHACEMETSSMLCTYPDLVKMNRVPVDPADSLKRTAHLPGSFTGIWWYGNHPEHYAGDARTASVTKGQKVQELMIHSLAEFVKAVKSDQVVPSLEREFFERERGLRDQGAGDPKP